MINRTTQPFAFPSILTQQTYSRLRRHGCACTDARLTDAAYQLWLEHISDASRRTSTGIPGAESIRPAYTGSSKPARSTFELAASGDLSRVELLLPERPDLYKIHARLHRSMPASSVRCCCYVVTPANRNCSGLPLCWCYELYCKNRCCLDEWSRSRPATFEAVNHISAQACSRAVDADKIRR